MACPPYVYFHNPSALSCTQVQFCHLSALTWILVHSNDPSALS